MLPIYLKLKNFLSHKESEIDFTALDPVTLIVGINNGDPKKSNGTGKSSLLDGITWALYEKCRVSGSKHTGLDDLVREGAKKAEVEFQFKLGDDLYRVVRSRNLTKRQSEVAFQIRNGQRWEPVSIDKKAETNNKIVELVGIDYDVFRRSVLLEQHDADGFAKLTPGGRKEVVSSILQLDHYDKYQKRAKEKSDEISLQLAQSETFLQDNATAEQDKQVAESELKTTQERLRLFEKQKSVLNRVIEKIREELNSVQKKVLEREGLTKRRQEIAQRLHEVTKRMKSWTERMENRTAEFKSLEEEVKVKYDKILELKENRGDPEKIKRALERARTEKEKIDEQHTEITIKVRTLLEKIEEIQTEVARIEKLDEGACPTCYSVVTGESKDNTLKELNSKLERLIISAKGHKGKLEEINAKRKDLNNSLDDAESKRDHYNNSNRQAKLLKRELDNAKQQLMATQQSIKDAEYERQMNKEELSKLQDEMVQVLERLETFDIIDEDHYERLQGEIGEKVAELEITQKSLDAFQIKKGQLQERIGAKATLIDKITAIKKGRAGLERELRIYRELISAFGKQGIQALILENASVEIEKLANNLLHTITDGAVSIKIATQRENRDGSLSECFDINIADQFHSHPYNLYSGGEKFRIALAIRIALSILLTRRAGVKVPAIFYDEAFTDLDADGVEKLMEVFTALSEDFRHQLIITHQTELKSQFNDVITITKSKDGSTISY